MMDACMPDWRIALLKKDHLGTYLPVSEYPYRQLRIYREPLTSSGAFLPKCAAHRPS